MRAALRVALVAVAVAQLAVVWGDTHPEQHLPSLKERGRRLQRLKASLRRLSGTENEIVANATSVAAPPHGPPAASVRASKEDSRVIALRAETTRRIIREGPGKEMKKITAFFKDMIAKLVERNKFDGNEDRMGWCKEMQAGFREVSTPFKEDEKALGDDAENEGGRHEELARQYVKSNVWALGMIENELDFLCGQGLVVVRGTTRLDDMKQVLKTYQESLACVPGDAPCSPNGKIGGVRPNCECKCKAGFKHGDEKRCEVAIGAAGFHLRAARLIVGAAAANGTSVLANGTWANGTAVLVNISSAKASAAEQLHDMKALVAGHASTRTS